MRAILRGALAGAAGTSALNAITYVDMALRARPASSSPQNVVDKIAERMGHPVPGEGDERANRLSGLGALTGVATGVGVGAVTGLLRAAGVRMRAVLSAFAIGAFAMAAADIPIVTLKISDPRGWSRADWLADAVPHMAYGAVTHAALRAFER